MSIFRSGLVNPIFVVCIKALKDSAVTFKEGEKYQLILDMGTMYVVKDPKGQEAVVPKDSFVLAKD